MMGHVICVCFTNVCDRFETPLKLFVPILCKHCESTIVAVGGIRVNTMQTNNKRNNTHLVTVKTGTSSFPSHR